MKILATCLLIFLSTSCLLAQEHPTVASQPNTIFVGADGKFEAPPDTAVIQFNISAQEDNSRAAFDRASKDAEQVRQILRSNGIEPKTAEIGFFSLDPIYDYKNAKRNLVAYRVNSSVTLKLKDFLKVAPILQQLADSDITDSQSVNYTLENMDDAKARAVEDAYRRARESAAVVARASGRTLGELSYATVDTFETRLIRPMMQALPRMSAQAAPMVAPTQEFSAQNITVTAHVNAMFTLK
ncbi:MAG: SIMPL domain-containing protein [Terriglobales bacterium]